MFITKFVRSYEIKYINKPKVDENLPCSEIESVSDMKLSCTPDRV